MVQRMLKAIFGSRKQTEHIGGHRCYAAFLYDEVEEYLEEIGRLNALLTDDPTDFVALNNRGVLQWELGNNEEALTDLRAACEHSNHDPLPHENAARFFKQQGASDKAIEAYERAMSIDPTSSTANSALGEICLANKDFMEAANCYSRAIEAHNDIPHFYRQRAKAYEGLGKTDAAAADLTKAKHIGS